MFQAQIRLILGEPQPSCSGTTWQRLPPAVRIGSVPRRRRLRSHQPKSATPPLLPAVPQLCARSGPALLTRCGRSRPAAPRGRGSAEGRRPVGEYLPPPHTSSPPSSLLLLSLMGAAARSSPEGAPLTLGRALSAQGLISPDAEVAPQAVGWASLDAGVGTQDAGGRLPTRERGPLVHKGGPYAGRLLTRWWPSSLRCQA